jgi:flagellar protein FliL
VAEEEVIESSGGGDHAGGEKRVSSKKLILFIILPLLLILGGGAGLYFTGMLDSVLKKKPPAEAQLTEADEKKAAEEADKGPGYYYDMPDILVNMNDTGNKSRYLKLSMSLELSSKAQEAKLQAVMPRITDNFQTYLRELRVDDLRGSAGIYRLRQELLARVRTAADPVVIRDVLFREILVQ